MTDQELMQEALKKWGKDSQLDVVVEECAELIDAIQKYKRGRVGAGEIAEEAVDVELCIQQLRIMFDQPEVWIRLRELKIDRLSKLLSIPSRE